MSKSKNTRRVNAVLCGPLCFTKFCNRFKNEADAGEWIKQKIENINSSKYVTANWIPGAFGEEKEKLFKEAHVFVFPSEYPVEAQPIVLIEAMSAGCALITSSAGEIKEEVKGSEAIIVEKVTVENIYREIVNLIQDDEKRLLMSRSSIIRASEFGLDVYHEKWGQIFSFISS